MRASFVLAICSIVIAAGRSSVAVAAAADAPPRPNILWLTTEDIGPQLGCYGDTYAQTPNLDRLAARGVIYLNAWSNAPVCAPARTTIITGVYPTSTGSEHMRSQVVMPPDMRMFPQIMRQAGYYCTNNSKEDYNLRKPGKVWDESSNKAHWRNRAAGQPFFAVFNNLITHESQIRTRPHVWQHNPAKAPLPAYHPDTLEVRQDWAQYYDNITTMDGWIGQRLKELDEAGLTEDTIVFFYGDHGSGMPRSKRWPYNSGLRVPLIVYVPPKFKELMPKDYAPGGKSERLVAFVDLAPTLLSLIGQKAPEWMQGHAFMGRHEDAPQEFLYGFRGRMDERYDLVRSVRDRRYIYVRNYMPHLIYGQHVAYMFQTPTTRVWKQLYDAGKLKPPQTYFWEPKPVEELYDLESDRDEVKNLAGSAEHREILERLRKAERDWLLRVRDVGFLPEGEIHSRSAGSSPYEVGHDRSKYPMERVLAMADLASSLRPDAVPALKEGLKDRDTAVRYWAAMGILMRGQAGADAARSELDRGLADDSPCVRIAAGEALGRFGSGAESAKALGVLVELANVEKNGVYVSMAALNAIDRLGTKAAPARDAILALPKTAPGVIPTLRENVPNLLQHVDANIH
jgi:arylsulfatase A-like enzyme